MKSFKNTMFAHRFLAFALVFAFAIGMLGSVPAFASNIDERVSPRVNVLFSDGTHDYVKGDTTYGTFRTPDNLVVAGNTITTISLKVSMFYESLDNKDGSIVFINANTGRRESSYSFKSSSTTATTFNISLDREKNYRVRIVPYNDNVDYMCSFNIYEP